MLEKGPVTIEATEWKVEKYEGKSPRQDKLSIFMRRWFPIRGKLPFEVVMGGEAKKTTVEFPISEPYFNWLRKRYPRTVGRMKKRDSS